MTELTHSSKLRDVCINNEDVEVIWEDVDI